MGDSQLFPPSSGSLTPGIPTPSGLTPNTRSEAEAAFTLNSLTQTESAAPAAPLFPMEANQDHQELQYDGAAADPTAATTSATEAQKAYRRPPGPLRTSSANYHEALMKARQESVSSNLSTNSDARSASITGENQISSPVSATTSTLGTVPMPPPGQGVVPLRTGIGAGQTDALKRVRPDGLSLAALGRQQSWSEQDMKHIYSGKLMVPPENDAGYSSGTEGRAV